MAMPSLFDFSTGLIIIAPFACASVILVCTLFFAFLFVFSKDSVYLHFLALNVVTLLFTATEIIILIVGGGMRNWQLSIQIHRIEQLLVLSFLYAVPLFLLGVVAKDSPLRKTLNIVKFSGLAAFCAIAAAAFIFPDLFVSVTKHTKTWLTRTWDYGRGQEGVLYTVRDALVGAMLIFSVVVLALEVRRTKLYSYMIPILAGFVVAIWFAASDIARIQAGFHIDPFFGLDFSRTPVGVTFFLILSMMGVLKRFLDQTGTLKKAFADLKESEAKLAETNELMNRFVPIEFLTYLDKSSIQEVVLGDCRKMYMTVLFSDIRSFTRLSERMTPEENFSFINDYLSIMVPIIRDYDGFVDKFVGDAIMALFPGGPSDAVRAAVTMREGLKTFNALRLSREEEAIDIGIGINSGELMIGTVGDKYRMEGTVISDAVNLASRMESLTKTYKLGILMSGESFQDLYNPTEINSRFIGQSRVKGKTTPIAVFEIFDGDDADIIELKRRTQSDFERGVVSLYSGRFAEAQGHFDTVLGQNKRDGAAEYYSRWIDRKRNTPVAPGKSAISVPSL
jgi:class 3 adenylate cyclase